MGETKKGAEEPWGQKVAQMTWRRITEENVSIREPGAVTFRKGEKTQPSPSSARKTWGNKYPDFLSYLP